MRNTFVSEKLFGEFAVAALWLCINDERMLIYL